MNFVTAKRHINISHITHKREILSYFVLLNQRNWPKRYFEFHFQFLFRVSNEYQICWFPFQFLLTGTWKRLKWRTKQPLCQSLFNEYSLVLMRHIEKIELLKTINLFGLENKKKENNFMWHEIDNKR